MDDSVSGEGGNESSGNVFVFVNAAVVSVACRCLCGLLCFLPPSTVCLREITWTTYQTATNGRIKNGRGCCSLQAHGRAHALSQFNTVIVCERALLHSTRHTTSRQIHTSAYITDQEHKGEQYREVGIHLNTELQCDISHRTSNLHSL